MIPRSFDYLPVASIEEALHALVDHGGNAKLLAGGHSLLPLMKLRLADPAVLVDLAAVPELRGIRAEGGYLAVGAMTTHYELTVDPLVGRHCGLLAEATMQIGDRQVRHRGTFGGALAHSDPAADHPAIARALDAELVIQSLEGLRTVPVADFFRGPYTTDLRPDEILREIRIPFLDHHWGYSYQKFNRVAQAWGIVSACALLKLDHGQILDARVALANMGPSPVRAAETERRLLGVPLAPDLLKAASAYAAANTSPPEDLEGDAGYRRHLARVLTERALLAAANTRETS
jgi:aerobic carbon-monoxide dehydrogenase medium subunit